MCWKEKFGEFPTLLLEKILHTELFGRVCFVFSSYFIFFDSAGSSLIAVRRPSVGVSRGYSLVAVHRRLTSASFIAVHWALRV